MSEFFNAAGNIDWTAVFEPDLSDKVGFSENSTAVIHKLTDDLNTYNFKLLPHDVIGAVFEQLIPENERHTLGQYFTRENLVDLINAFCIQTTNAFVLDPTCGTGTFLTRAYNKKKTEGLYDHKELLGQLWGVDIANFPAELATINLFRQNVSEISNFPRIVCKDIFDVQPESTHKFPPLKKSPDPNFQSIDEKMPLFDAAVGNFPFIRQELIEKAGEEHLGFNKTGKQTNSLNGMETREDDNFRIRIKKQSELLDELNKEGKTAKWGFYLRAPNVYFDIINKCGDKLSHLNKVATIQRGITTGINDFFYLTEDKIKHWGIEDEFLIPVFKSPKESSSIAVDSKTLTLKVFSCSWTKVDLQKANKNGALKYISYGEKQKGEDGISWSERPSVINRKPGWWALTGAELANIFWSKSYDFKLYHRYSESPILADCRLYFVSTKEQISKKLLAVVLNSSISLLFLELIGRVNLGEGALDVMVEDAENYMIIPDLNSIPADTKKKLLLAFDKMAKRPAKPIFEEVKMKDRQQLDSLIMEVLGLDPKVYLKPLYDGLTGLVRERIDLGKMHTKAKKAKIAIDTEQIKNQVIEEILPNGVKKFPEDFLKKPLKTSECYSVQTPGELLKLGGQFMTEHEVFTESGFKFMAPSTETAKYIVYAQKSNLYLISYPKDAVTASKTVQAYEIYVKDIKEKLRTELANRITDYKLADNITDQILAERGLPQIS